MAEKRLMYTSKRFCFGRFRKKERIRWEDFRKKRVYTVSLAKRYIPQVSFFINMNKSVIRYSRYAVPTVESVFLYPDGEDIG